MSFINVVGFIEDTIFKTNFRLSVNNTEYQNIGYLNSTLIDYYVDIAKLKDNRSSRLSILNTGLPATGDTYILFDNSKVEDSSIWNTLTNNQIDTIFNIAETMYLYQSATNDELEHILATDGAYLNSYVPLSLARSSVSTSISISNPLNMTITVPNWIEFQLYVSEDKATILKFKLWLNSEDFAISYPNTTITNIIPPCPPEILFTTVKNHTQMQTTIENSVFSFSKLNTELYTKDQSGCKTFYVRYYLDSETEYVVPFGVIYKGGIEPTTSACRIAIKDYLIATGLTTIANLQIYFPELFVNYIYNVIPLWNYKNTLEDRIVYPSISPNYNYIKTELLRLYPTLTEDFIETRIEIILNAENDMFSLVVPDSLNNDTASLASFHPTFNRHSSTETAYAYMDTNTKLLASKLAKAFAVFNQTLTTDEFNTVVIEDKTYLSFTVNNVEVQVLSPSSYGSSS